MNTLSTNRIFLSTILICIIHIFGFGQTNLFTETFDEVNGSTSGISAEGIPWTTDCPQCPSTPTAQWDVQNGGLLCHNSDGPVTFESDVIDVSNCDMILVTFEYTGDDYPGSGNLESNDECNFGSGCPGDVSNPLAGDCPTCWDFMDFNIYLDNVQNKIGTIGNGLNVTAHTFSQLYSTVGIDEAYLFVASQTWGATEDMRMELASVVCTDLPCEIEANVTSGGDVCPGECTTVEVEITGGEPVYDLQWESDIVGFSFDFNSLASNNIFTLNVCATDDAFPNYFGNTNTLNVPGANTGSVVLDLAYITDGAMCMVFVDVEPIIITVLEKAEAISPPPVSLCDNGNGTADIDLSDYNDIITGGNGDIVEWYLDMELTMPTPDQLTTGPATFYAVIDNGLCLSDPVVLTVSLISPPDIFDVISIVNCGPFPLFTIQGNNLSGNEAYYTEPNGQGTVYQPGYIVTESITLYAYDGVAGCDDEDEVPITIIPQPEIYPLTVEPACDFYELPFIEGENLTGNEAYYTGLNGTGTMYEPGDTIFSTTQIYAYDINQSCFDNELLNIVITQSPSFTMPDQISQCGYVVLPTIQGSNLSGNAYYSTNPDGSGIQYQAGDTIFMSNVLYIYDQIIFCESSQEINIQIEPGPEFTPINNVEFCDFYELPNLNVVPLNNPAYFDLPDGQGVQYLPGDTIFNTITLYAYDELMGNPDCYGQEEFTVTILETPDAGDDQMISTCAESIIELLDLLPDGVPTDGIFTDPNNLGVLNGSIVDLTGSTETLINIGYELQNNCGVDQSSIIIEVVTVAEAGDDFDTNECPVGIINLFDYINGDAGGLFYDNQGNDIGSTVDLDTINSSIFSAYYIVGDGNNCPLDSAFIEITIDEQASFSIQDTVISCDIYELPTIVGTNLSGDELYSSASEGAGVQYEVGDTLFNSAWVYVYDAIQCQSSDSFYVELISAPVSIFNDELCQNETITISGVDFSIDNPSDTIILQSANGCDSLIYVELNFITVDTFELAQTLCFGQSVMVNNVTYDEANPSGIESIPNGSSTGCDSIVRVDLTFNSASFSDVNNTICPGESMFINGIEYNESNPTGQDTTQTMSGCDSILIIELSFFNTPSGQIDTTICSGESIVINGTLYDVNNPSGTETLINQSVNGCDSLVEVQLDFFSMSVGILDTSICVGEFIVVNGTTYDQSNPTGIETYLNQASTGCDSILEVSLSFLQGYSEDIIMDLCPNESIVVNGTVYDMDNPVGEELVPSMLAGVCDSVFSIDLSFYTIEQGLIEESLCEGSNIEIDGIIYDENNPTGQFVTTTLNGCDSIVMIQLDFYTPFLDFELELPDCDNPGAKISIESANFGSNPYYYTDNNGVENEIILPANLLIVENGPHDIWVYDDEGCGTNIFFELEEVEIPSIVVPQLLEINSGEFVQINIDIPDTYTIVWTPTTGLSCSDCPNPIASPSVTSIYQYTIITNDMCYIEGTLEIRVLENDNSYYIPTIFSPNNDGLNEDFYLASKEEMIYDMYIFDRWGNLMFEAEGIRSNRSDEGWNGQFNGRDVNSGVYVYKINIYIENTTKYELVSSTITLLR